MTVHPSPKNLAKDFVRQTLPKVQPRRRKPRNPGESKTRKLVRKRSGGWCEICGAARAESVHHRRNRSQGGPWTASNCVATCGDGTRGCHGWVGRRPAAAHDSGFHLEHGEIPAKTAIVSGLHGHVLLDDFGGMKPAKGGAA
ncbi:HNH endonuclease [Nocardia sp. CDC159]|uniref:HNH endonuclease n=1 Tax=Nocardia pulmonis TaxID=2951408 RepID=A0A9X2E8H5_9NOCA|nr:MULTISPECIES: HNH endonuclease signature motif containing protein [Nocardia]MCM6776249.1 HNH endonuclease [Nocardia pulmonis]MCM6788425.1 HNH endonuclease [Nocardia sp. CDC159]